MSISSGIPQYLAKALGLSEALPPHIRCDGCGATYPSAKTSKWNDSPPGWTCERYSDGLVTHREDYCKSCTHARS